MSKENKLVDIISRVSREKNPIDRLRQERIFVINQFAPYISDTNLKIIKASSAMSKLQNEFDIERQNSIVASISDNTQQMINRIETLVEDDAVKPPNIENFEYIKKKYVYEQKMKRLANVPNQIFGLIKEGKYNEAIQIFTKFVSTINVLGDNSFSNYIKRQMYDYQSNREKSIYQNCINASYYDFKNLSRDPKKTVEALIMYSKLVMSDIFDCPKTDTMEFSGPFIDFFNNWNQYFLNQLPRIEKTEESLGQYCDRALDFAMKFKEITQTLDSYTNNNFFSNSEKVIIYKIKDANRNSIFNKYIAHLDSYDLIDFDYAFIESMDEKISTMYKDNHIFIRYLNSKVKYLFNFFISGEVRIDEKNLYPIIEKYPFIHQEMQKIVQSILHKTQNMEIQIQKEFLNQMYNMRFKYHNEENLFLVFSIISYIFDYLINFTFKGLISAESEKSFFDYVIVPLVNDSLTSWSLQLFNLINDFNEFKKEFHFIINSLKKLQKQYFNIDDIAHNILNRIILLYSHPLLRQSLSDTDLTAAKNMIIKISDVHPSSILSIFPKAFNKSDKHFEMVLDIKKLISQLDERKTTRIVK